MRLANQSLLTKLLLVTCIPAVLIVIILWLAIDKQAAGYFMALMKNYDIDPTEIHQIFLTSIHTTLFWASIAALMVSFFLSFLLIRQVLKPLSQMTKITEKVATGDFSTRVEVTTKDEVGRLGSSFNEMADNLAAIEQLRHNMVADVAHELRTPLTNLRGYLEALNDNVLPPSEKTLGVLQEETMRLVKLVENLQQLARADAARAFLNREEVDLGKEIDYLLTLYKLGIAEKNIRLSTDFGMATLLVNGDRDKLLQACSNLLDNCIKFSPVGGEITLKGTEDDKGVSLSFCNTGPGISGEDLPFIFERFFRPDKSRSREVGGAGIGLAITRELIEAHQGTIGAESDDGLTCIHLWLPA